MTTSSADRPQPGTASVLTHGLHQAAPDTTELETALEGVELRLAALGHALAGPDPAAVESAADELRVAMRAAMESFAQVSRRGVMPPAIRQRLAMASGQVAAQREALFRATTALDQAIEILIPRPDSGGVYSPQGAQARAPGRVIAAS